MVITCSHCGGAKEEGCPQCGGDSTFEVKEEKEGPLNRRQIIISVTVVDDAPSTLVPDRELETTIDGMLQHHQDGRYSFATEMIHRGLEEIVKGAIENVVKYHCSQLPEADQITVFQTKDGSERCEPASYSIYREALANFTGVSAMGWYRGTKVLTEEPRGKHEKAE